MGIKNEVVKIGDVEYPIFYTIILQVYFYY